MDLGTIKNEIREYLINKLTPRAVIASYETPLSDGINNYMLAQSFIPHSTCFRPRRGDTSTNLPVTLSLVKYGTPNSGVKVSLQASNHSNLPSGIDISIFKISPNEINSSSTLITKNIVLTDYLTSKQEYNIIITPEFAISPTNYIAVNRDNVDNKYRFGTAKKYTDSWVPEDYDIYFNVQTPGWIYTDYPRVDLNLKSYPRMTVEISRPRSVTKWIDKDYIEYYLSVHIQMWSEYLDEIDNTLSVADQVLFENRTKFSNLIEYIPGNLTRPSPYRQNLITRILIASARKKQGVE